MMQDKNDINAMAKKYKEEMMLAYSKKRIGGDPPGSVPQAPKKEEKERIYAPSPKIKHIEDMAIGRTQQDEKKHDTPAAPVIPKMEVSDPGSEKRAKKDLDHPPMPKIPSMEKMTSPAEENKEQKKPDRQSMPVIPEIEAAESCQEPKCQEKGLSCPPMPEISSSDDTEDKPEKWKFLTAEELIKKEMAASQNVSPDTEALSHHQGNYDFPTAPDEEYKKEVEEFVSEQGEGYLQVEVTCGEKGCPIEGAAIAVTRQTGDTDVLVATLVTGKDGCTNAVTLPSNREKYMITVYKEGFFTVHDLDVPIFDMIKSIQPVTMTEIGGNS